MQQPAAINILSDAHRPIRLRLFTDKGIVAGRLLVQGVSGTEAVCGGIDYRLLCVGPQAALKLKQFIAMPAELKFVTASGQARTVCGIIDSVEEGEADNGLATYQLILRDALSIMDKNCNSRISQGMNEVEITERILQGWQRDNPVLSYAFRFELWRTKPGYPQRETTMQYKESDAAFLRRLWKRRGLAWFFKPQPQHDEGDPLAYALVLFDQDDAIERCAAGTIRFHRDDSTELADSITASHPLRTLRPGSAVRQSWDYKDARSHHASADTAADQGHFGSQFADGLTDRLIDVQHVGDDGEDAAALATSRAQRHAMNAKCWHGEGGGRDWAPGQWFELSGFAAADALGPNERQFVFTEMRVAAESNLPKDFSERVQRLFQAGGWLDGANATGSTSVKQASVERDGRYTAHFVCVRRLSPIVPAFDPRTSLTEDIDAHATDHSTIMTNGMHAQKALAYDVAIGNCHLLADDLHTFRVAADWRYWKGLMPDHINRPFFKYFLTRRLSEQAVSNWAAKSQEGRMPESIVDQREDCVRPPPQGDDIWAN